MAHGQDDTEPSGPMKWFRAYSEMFSDTKIRRLPVSHRWCWMAMLSIASQSKPRGVCMIADKTPATIEDIADYANIPVDECAAAIAVFVQREMVREDDGFYVICNWGKRQFASDDVTARTSKAKQKNVPGNNAGTFPRTTPERPTEYRVQSTENRPQKAEVTAQNEDDSVANATGASAGEYDEFADFDEPQDEVLLPERVTAREPNATYATLDAIAMIVAGQPADAVWKKTERGRFCGVLARMLLTYPQGDIVTCARWLQSNEFYQSTGIDPMTLEKQMARWSAAGKPLTFAAPSRTSSRRVMTPEELAMEAEYTYDD